MVSLVRHHAFQDLHKDLFVLYFRHMGDDGEMRRPWCPATRILEHREAQLLKEKAEDRKHCTGVGPGTPTKKPRTDFPALKVCPVPACMRNVLFSSM